MSPGVDGDGGAVNDEYRIDVTDGGTVMLRVGDYLLCLPPAAALHLATELGQAATRGAEIHSRQHRS